MVCFSTFVSRKFCVFVLCFVWFRVCVCCSITSLIWACKWVENGKLLELNIEVGLCLFDDFHFITNPNPTIHTHSLFILIFQSIKRVYFSSLLCVFFYLRICPHATACPMPIQSHTIYSINIEDAAARCFFYSVCPKLPPKMCDQIKICV